MPGVPILQEKRRIEVRKKHMKTLVFILRSTPEQLLTYFATLHPKATKGDKFTYVPGDYRMPLLVAHADTVHKELPAKIFLDEKKRLMTSPTGIGGDDRAGVHALLSLYAALVPKPGLLLCDEEESGGYGATSASYDLFDELQKYPFFIEIDRRGTGGCVFYNDEHEEFIKYIESFGFKEETGIYSDIRTLGEETKKCSVNLSAGYEYAHTNNETLDLDSLEYTIRHTKAIMLAMLTNPPKISFKLPKPAKIKKYDYSSSTRWNSEWDSEFTDRDAPETQVVDKYFKTKKYGAECEECGSEDDVKYTDLRYGYLCSGCRAWVENDANLPVVVRSPGKIKSC